jgi:hypothetical protein
VSGLQKQRLLLTAKPAELLLFQTGADMLTFAVLALATLAASYRYSRLAQVQNSLTGSGSQLSSKSACCGSTGVGLRELDFPYYSLRGGFNSQLNLVSDSPKPIDLTIAIYSQRGSSVLTGVTTQPGAELQPNSLAR